MSRSIRVYHAARMRLKWRTIAYNHSPEWYHGLESAWRRNPCPWWKHGVEYYPISHTPSWWIREFHTVEQRAQEKALCQKVVGGVDADGLNWPLARKPHHYYW
jgi:hypothetical protein